jgi:hypothetical protein
MSKRKRTDNIMSKRKKSRKTVNLFLGFADNFCILTTLTQRICPVLFYEKNKTRTPLKTGSELKFPGSVSSSQ